VATIHTICFDVFGTVFDMSSIPQDEIRDYVRHVKSEAWSPLVLPDSWRELKAHPDSREGIERLSQNFAIATFSNGPVWLLEEISHANGIEWNYFVPVADARGYKPATWIYPWGCGFLGAAPSDVMLVTANATFGDLEGAAACGMVPQLVRHEGHPLTLIELAERLGC